MAVSNKTNENKKSFLALLEKNMGNVTEAAKKAKISRWTHYNWYKEDKEYKKNVDEIQESLIDRVESQLYSLIDKGNVTAVIFFLKTKGKSRGYEEKTVIEHKETKNIPEYFKQAIKAA